MTSFSVDDEKNEKSSFGIRGAPRLQFLERYGLAKYKIYLTAEYRNAVWPNSEN